MVIYCEYYVRPGGSIARVFESLCKSMCMCVIAFVCVYTCVLKLLTTADTMLLHVYIGLSYP